MKGLVGLSCLIQPVFLQANFIEENVLGMKTLDHVVVNSKFQIDVKRQARQRTRSFEDRSSGGLLGYGSPTVNQKGNPDQSTFRFSDHRYGM